MTLKSPPLRYPAQPDYPSQTAYYDQLFVFSDQMLLKLHVVVLPY